MTDKPLKIVSLQAENVKRLKAVRIDPKGNLVEITGRNAQGKTSILDSIWWALAGAGNVQSTPIRKGQDRATIKLDMGDVVVTRTFTRREDGSTGTSITVENGEGARFPTPQRMIDGLLGSLTFDPLAFARMKPKEQFDALAQFVPDVDFANIDNLNRGDFEKRAAVNRRHKDLTAQAAAIAIPSTVPTERVDEEALITELGEVGEFNATIDRRREGREKATLDAATYRNEADALIARAKKLREEAEGLDAEATAKVAKAAELEKRLEEAEALPEPKDAAEVRARLERAKAANAALDRVAQRQKLIDDAAAAKTESEEITARMEARVADKHKAIEAAKLPVEGLGFGEDCITLNGVPFDQASDAEQLRVSCAIAMASNPRLRVIRVRDGSLLDDEALLLLGKMADAGDYQVWIERVDSSGKVGFVIEDGQVRSAPGSEPQQQAAE